MKKLSKILLIDDSEADNYIHVRRLNKAAIAEEIVIKYNGREGINYLKGITASVPPRPELIFLDINMPVMNGWEFLDEYERMPESKKGRTLVTMLTTSGADTDRKQAAGYKSIDEYLEKPLTQDKIDAIIASHFPDLE